MGGKLMNYVCQKECFFDRRYLVGEVITNKKVYDALKPFFKTEKDAGVVINNASGVLPTSTMTELATKDRPQLPEIPDVLGGSKTKTAQKTSSATKK